MNRKVVVMTAAALAAMVLLLLILFRSPLRRRRVVRSSPPPTATHVKPGVIAEDLPVDQWTGRFIGLQNAGDWKTLDATLDAIQSAQPELYKASSLGYLHARARIESGEPDDAIPLLEPFLKEGNPLRDLALFHRAAIADEEEDSSEARRFREFLIYGYPESLYREEAIDDQLSAFEEAKDDTALLAFVGKMRPSSPARKRELEARSIEALIRRGENEAGLTRGLALLRESIADDAADRVTRSLDTPELLGKMPPLGLLDMGESARNHRHFDRAVAILPLALQKLPLQSDDILFSIGRSHFGAEKFAEARAAYLRGRDSTRDPRMKATFCFHASRCAQLAGDDAGAEQLMTEAIAVPGRFPATAAALTQRMRTRLLQKRPAEAAADLAMIRKLFPDDHTIVDASLSYALAMIASGRSPAAVATLDAIPPALFDKYDPFEIAYWKARALEGSNVAEAFQLYLKVLRAPVSTHFAYFTRKRLGQPALRAKLRNEIARRSGEAERLIATKELEKAKDVQTDVALLDPESAVERKKLASIYRELPAYSSILDLQPQRLPDFPVTPGAARLDLLMAMGLFDDAIDGIKRRYPLRPASSALTQSATLNLGDDSKGSIYAIEVMSDSLPDDFLPDLLPDAMRQLLYPRYFYSAIVEDSEKYGADPRLVLSIMREESRFNPRAKSVAAARGLLQFIMTTALDVGRSVGIVELDPEDLYDPRIIIQLGAKYIGTLLEEFGRNPYRAAAAYNAGPRQVALWSRLAPASGDDFFLSSINFEETKHYVRKVLNSYERYGEIYEKRGVTGGVEIKP